MTDSSATPDKEALREKYRQERDKRLRADGNDQYLEIKGQLAHYLEDPYVPITPRKPLSDHVNVAVIGGGSVALRKAEDLLRCGARLHVIAPCLHEGFETLAQQYGDRLVVTKREYRHGDVGESLLAFAATDDETVNRAVFDEARERSILINAADDPPNCSFFLPSSSRAGGGRCSTSSSERSAGQGRRHGGELRA